MTRDEADTMLRSAIEQHARVFELANDDELLSDFAVVASWQPEIARGSTTYSLHFHQPSIPNHIAIGLFATGERLALQDDDEEDP